MRDLGTIRGTNHPRPLDSYPKDARDLNAALILAFVIVTGIIAIADHSFARVDRAYEIAGRV